MSIPQQQHTIAPPSYTPAAPANKKGYSAIPQTDAEGSAAPAGYAAPEYGFDPEAPRTEGDAESDDFKYGVTVDQCSAEIRMQFLKKIYSVLFIQVLGTAIVGAIMSTENISLWVRENQWAFIAPSFASLIVMGFLFWKRHSHPLNLGLLGLFTLLESLSLGAVCSYVDSHVVLQALLITTFVFLGLTLYTFQSKRDFSGMAPWLFGGLLFLVGGGLVQLFVPFSHTVDMLMAGAGTLVFSGYIVFDTYMITRRLSPDEWVLGVISLYLDMINLFLSILRLLNGNRDD